VIVCVCRTCWCLNGRGPGGASKQEVRMYQFSCELSAFVSSALKMSLIEPLAVAIQAVAEAAMLRAAAR
jgi:hypothetical protein